MRYLYLLICISLLISCSKAKEEIKVEFKSDLLLEAYILIKDYKETDHIIEKIIRLDVIADKTLKFIKEDSLWNDKIKDKFKKPVISMFVETLVLCKNIKQNLRDSERIKIIESIDIKLNDCLNRLEKFSKVKKIS